MRLWTIDGPIEPDPVDRPWLRQNRRRSIEGRLEARMCAQRLAGEVRRAGEVAERRRLEGR
ncbi:MAG TPA: hypothetical protein VNO23_12760 [Candidatus Binatia bacterium]|nr:hypothetical protein [Candidatus Binatia bacterium]